MSLLVSLLRCMRCVSWLVGAWVVRSLAFTQVVSHKVTLSPMRSSCLQDVMVVDPSGTWLAAFADRMAKHEVHALMHSRASQCPPCRPAVALTDKVVRFVEFLAFLQPCACFAEVVARHAGGCDSLARHSGAVCQRVGRLSRSRSPVDVPAIPWRSGALVLVMRRDGFLYYTDVRERRCSSCE